MRGIGILINNNYELIIQPTRDATGKLVSGIVTGNTLYQNTGLILIARMGEFKEQPVLGVGIEDVLLDDDYLNWRSRIRTNLELDGQTVNEITFTNANNLSIDADYNNG